MVRPYFKYSIDQLEKLFSSSKDNPSVLQTLFDELKNRKTRRARGLLNEVEDCLLNSFFSDGSPKTSPPPPSGQSKENNVVEIHQPKYHSVTWIEDLPLPWEAKSLDGRTYIGNYETEEEAAEALSNFHKISKDDLLKLASNHKTSTQSKPPEKPKTALKKDSATDTSFVGAEDIELSKVFKKLSPKGSAPNRPEKWVFNKKNTMKLGVKLDDSLISVYRAGITNLIFEMKRKGAGAKKINLENGKSLDLKGTEPGYQFPYDEGADLFEGSKITIFIGNRRSPGQVVSITGGVLIISIQDDYGPTIHACVIQIDNTSILEALNDRLLEVEEGKKTNFNKALAEQVVKNENKENPALVKDQLTGLDILNNEQKESVLKALSNEVLYIWGPPGTGKTKTLGVLIRALFDENKKVLICSNTNQAVDQVLLKLCTELSESHKALQEGNIIRIGAITHDELKSKWSEYITIEEIIKKKSADLMEKKVRLSQQISDLNKQVSDLELIIEGFDKVRVLNLEIEKVNSVISNGKRDLKKLDSEIKNTESKIKESLEEHQSFLNAGTLRRIMMKSEDQIVKDRAELEAQKKNLINKSFELKRSVENAPQTLEKLKVEMAEILKLISNKQKSTVEKELKKIQKDRKDCMDELSAINKKLEEIAKSVMEEATIIGATVTKAFVSSNQLPQFDVVIVDEASMVMAPALFYVAGFANEKVIISGDFRQLSPVVPTDEEETFEAIGRDIFESAGITKAVDSKRSANRLVMLNKQYRMDNEICNMVSESMYDGVLITASNPSATTSIPPLFANALTLVDTSSVWPFANKDNFKSRYNLMHALAIRNLCFHLNEQSYLGEINKLGVCTPYAAQAKLLKKILSSHQLENRVSAGTVHRFQGDEKETIILDISDSWGEKHVGVFLQADRPEEAGAKLFNVAVSRAQKHLIVFANLTFLEDKLPDLAILRELLYTVQSKGKVIDVRDVLSMYPIVNDLKKLGGTFDLDLETEETGLFKQSDFDKVFLSDLGAAEKSVVIFSGFITPQRVGAYIDMFRSKLEEGVAIRCVTRPPNNNAVDYDQSMEALDALESIGCIVDTRWSIHQKVVIIDERILWYGSLNPLSHTSRTDEIMARIDNPEAASQMGLFISLNPDGSKKNGGILTQKENPRCPKCQDRNKHSRATYRTGRYGPYWSCEDQECDWKESLNKPTNKKPGFKQTANTGSVGGIVSPDGTTKEAPNCPLCGKKMTLRRGPYGSFFGCPGFPRCKGKANISGGKKKR